MPHASETRFRVRYAETDQMGVVYYANYLVWMEVGRTDFCKTLGFSYKDMEREGAFLAVVEVTCRYLAPARYDDAIVVETRLQSISRRLVTCATAIRNAESNQLLAKGKTILATLGVNGRSRSLPEHYYELLSKATAESPGE